MRTSLTRRGYAVDKESVSTDVLDEIRKLLTVAPKLSPGNPMYSAAQAAVARGDVAPGTFAVYRESGRRLYMPRALGLSRYGAPMTTDDHMTHMTHMTSTTNRTPPSTMVFHPAGLRPEQEAPVAAFIQAARDPMRRGGILSLPCGGGKTVCALKVASELGLKTLVVAHKEFLLDQWRERIAFFLPLARVGLIKAKRADDSADYDIVLGSLQSIAMKDYCPEMFDGYGLVVFDECHHLSAEVFSRALPKVACAAVMMGLSATLDRKDGLREVFEWFLGKIVNEPPRPPPGPPSSVVDMIVRVHAYPPADTATSFDESHAYGRPREMWNGSPNFTAMMTDVVNHAPRTRFLVTLLLDAMDAEDGRRALILSDRRAHLIAIEVELLKRNESRPPESRLTVGYFMGGMKPAALKASEGCHIMLGTVSMAQEAMDCPHLDTLLFATPLSSVEQAVGRIQRQKPADRRYVPLTLDIVDEMYGVFKGQARKRHTFYKKRGFVVMR